jgi:class 3 adenylate cyclase/TolB-like protein
MAEERAQRHLAAIFAADVVGYARLMEQDEADTFARLRAHRKELFEPEIARHQGRIFKLMGDGLLAEFGSVVDAVECAVVLQRGMAERNNGIPEDRRIDVRIGVNLGDVIVEGEDRHGEGVNIAARLQELSEPGGICISQQAFDQVETKLDLAYEDLGEHLVKNIVKAIHVYRVAGEGARAARRFPKMRRPKLGAIAGGLVALLAVGGAIGWYWTTYAPPAIPPPGPRIAVLSFSNAGGSPDDTAFTDGLAEDIGAALSRFADVFVISGDSTRRFAGESVNPQEVGRALGVSYVLAGSVRRSQSYLRITARLLRVEDGGLVSSENYDVPLTDANALGVEDDVAGLLAGRIASPETPLWKSEAEKASRQLRAQPADALVAYDCVLLSYAIYDSFTKEAHGPARDCLEHAVELVPTYAVAWARLGQMYFEEYKYKWNYRPDPLGRARAAAQKSIELDQHIAEGYHVLALVHYASESDFGAFRETAEKAIAINPNNMWTIADLGIWTFYSGAWERGTLLIERAKVLNPDYPRWLDFAFVLDHYRKHEYLEAKAVALKIDLPKNHMVQAALAAAYGELGEYDKARSVIDQIRTIKPGFVDDPRAEFKARKMPDELVESLMDGLRKAGLDVPPAGP